MVSQSNEVASAVRSDVEELVRLTNLRAAVHDERNWASTMIGINALGLPVQAIESMAGIPIRAEMAEAVDRVDASLAAGDYTDITDQISQLRNAPDVQPDTPNLSYTAVEIEVAAQSDVVLNRLLKSAGEVEAGSELITSLRVLESAVQMRESFAYQLSFYFTAQFSVDTAAASDTADLISQIALYDSASTALGVSTEGVGVVLEQQMALADSADQARFRSAVDELVIDAFAGAVTEEPSQFSGGLPDIARIAETFLAGTVTSDGHLELVQTAGAEVTRASDDVTETATDATREAVRIIALVGAISILLAATLAQFIVRPLKRLARIAKNLRDGDTDVLASLRGPREVQSATEALNEAVSHLQLAERQASALAEGNLGHAALAETASGTLGASLQTAVQTLASSLSEREDFRKRLAHETTHDALTGLPNRNTCLVQLQRSLARSTRAESSVAVLSVDLDNFNEVNDRLGHPAGDRVLRAVARRLVTAVREGDQVGRLGGDEFLVIAEPVSGPHEAITLATRITELLAEPLPVDGTTVQISASVGIAITDSGVLTADEMLRDSDLAVHKSKSIGTGRIEVCDESLRAEILRQADLKSSLERAIEEEELTLFFQPIVRSIDREIRGYEALVRWNRPDGRLASPIEFIPLAERSDLIIEIDRWVLQSAAKQLAEWAATTDFASMTMSVNVSGRHLSCPDFLANVLEPMKTFGVDPQRMIIEVTESALLDDLGEAATKLQELRDHGVRIAIDDFGTGYTSLAHLKTLPIDILKIDESFTNDLDSRSLVKLIIDTGHLLGAQITAEGIETKEARDALIQLGSDSLQGYYFARPAPPDQLRNCADTHTPSIA